ncbi:hypothetical protein P152DRAFT_494487 [Eremomyces bilateralis CBS 781.70]|uniref:Sin3-associated polypeptide Sap18 n=1 Tax=Eremomyces bilateralis CBS 781.70 TaxID=1392243 RepID=A0A6G1FV17_9PEZI|nr:uncharacterized protein P152DRAFT_494487 [Eremomyces bilateralis CBS 781.70]KAF1809522.1 hypothetical protein P152DRAFT_494487 [Eremomyces bilateralis CBS 781.70]
MAAPPAKIDRQKTTPFLLKLFYRTGGYHRLDEFTPNSPQPPPPHLQIYTWPTCSLRELTHLLTAALPSLLPSPAIGTRLTFRLIFPDTRSSGPGPPRYIAKDLGSVVIGAGGPGVEGIEGATTEDETRKALEKLDGDAEKTLQDARFVIGDYVDCAVFPPLPNGDVAAGSAPRFAGPMTGGPGRENGFGGGPIRHGRGFRNEGRGGSFLSGDWRRGEVPPGGGFRGRGRRGGY